MQMKTFLFGIVLSFLGVMSVNSAKASYPVASNEKSETVSEQVNSEKEMSQSQVWYEKLVGSGKSQVTALLLVLLVGGIGIHRFYLGYTGIGIIQLLTFGACGIWSLIDCIRIITGDLGPKSGRYSKKL